MRTAAVILSALVLGAYTWTAGAEQPKQVSLQNRFVQRVFELDDGQWRTVRFARAEGTDAVEVQSDEFLIRLPDGTELTAADYSCSDTSGIAVEQGVQVLTLRCLTRKQIAMAPTEIALEYRLADDPYLRKQVEVRMPPAGALDRLEVERFRTTTPCRHGGHGEPILLGPSWFMGLEYPGSETSCAGDQVSLAHFPGRVRHDAASGLNVIKSKTAVAGVGRPGDPIELAFADYLDTVRRPGRMLLHYNSWYDFRENELTQEALLGTFEAFKRNVLDPFGLTMHVFVPDDGWQRPQSIWVPRSNLYPDGFRPLREALESRGTHLGLWMPFNGFNLDVKWGAGEGYEKSDQGRYYCLTGPKYDAEIRRVIDSLIRQGNIKYFKHDFNQLQCSADGHGHLPDARHGHEANLDAELELLALERRLQPDIFLNVTSYVWHSPWWLMHADSIWMDADDFGYNTDFPQLSPREWDMSYRDAHFYKLYVQRKTLVPLSAMMTHGIIHGRYQLLGGKDETLREWSDCVVMYYGRGVQLMEWYITPDLMTAQRWEVLGRATRWAVENRGVLENVVYVGGDPRKGQAHGYAHWNGDRGLLVLRNPAMAAQKMAIPFDKSVRYRGPGGKLFHGRVVYPYVERLPGSFTSGQPAQIAVPGCSVLVCELSPLPVPAPDPVATPAMPPAACEVVRGPEGSKRVIARIAVPSDQARSYIVEFIVRSPCRVLPETEVSVDGRPVQPRDARGPDWLIRGIDVSDRAGRTVNVTLDLPENDGPFEYPDMSLNVWLLADLPVEEAGEAPVKDLPLPISRGFRRQTAELLAETKFAGQAARHSLTAADLAGIRSAKLRILVFDSNGDPPYDNKSVLLNGAALVNVPANSGPLSEWQQHIIEVSSQVLPLVSLDNEVRVVNPGGDYFKFTGLALAVQLADGSWVQTVPNEEVFSSVSAWSYAEGRTFVDGRSGPVTLKFAKDSP